MDIFSIIPLIVLAFSLLVVIGILFQFVKEDYKDGYNDCIQGYKARKKVILRHGGFIGYNRGWNDACEDITKNL